MLRYLLLTTALLCSVANAELVLIISGPTDAKVGQAVILNTVGTVANAFNWIIPQELEGKVLGGIGDCNQQLGFFPEVSGKYVFHLYGTDGDVLNHTTHTVVVTGKTPPVEPPVEPPIDPPPSDSDFAELAKLSKDLSIRLDQPAVRSQLAKDLSKASFGDTLTTSQTAVEVIVTNVFASRPRDDQDADWFNGWYVPVLKAMLKLSEDGEIKNVADYSKAIASVANGLK